ncbi:hypothetical protein [Saliphagus sp. LR7]|uniref:hypothetical protein n=1 Tax=Saliphagus sp. LR7 TaxID=2282654 RepID=UPI000DF80EF3|nr:hypothetical protein [Saliphagus sp. LR7]
MGVIDRIEEEYVDVSTSRRSLREVLELVAGAVVLVVVGGALAGYLLGRGAGIAVGGLLAAILAVTVVSQAYWAATGRADYRE